MLYSIAVFGIYYTFWHIVALRITTSCIQLFWERLSAKLCTRKCPKGKMGYDQYTVFWHCSCRTCFCCFPLASQTYVHGLSCHSFKFLWRTVNSKLPTIPLAVIAWTFSDNLSRNSCKKVFWLFAIDTILRNGWFIN